MQPFMNLSNKEKEFIFNYRELLSESLRRIVGGFLSNDDVALGSEIADRDIVMFNLGRKYESELHNH